jgi:mono/diheme cytochrome c family protein
LALGAGIVLMVGFAGGYLVATNVGPERGAPPPPPPQAASPSDQELAGLAERLQRDPNDVQALLRLAHLHLDRGQVDPARAMYHRVLHIEPRNVEAITHLGNVAAAGGQVDEALRHYDAALAIDPKYAHALWDKALALQHQKGNPAAAVPIWEAFLKVMPPGSPDYLQAQRMLEEARKGRIAVAGRSEGGGGEAPGAIAVPASLPGAVAQGKVLYEKWGCGRCHAIGGRGGTIGPDLTRAGAKGRDLAWHIRHLKNPAAVVPGSLMPPTQGASEEDLRAVAEYMLSLK